MSVPVSKNQQNQSRARIGWCGLKALFAKAISCERSAKLGLGVLFNARQRKNNFSSFTQSCKADNQSSLAPLILIITVALLMAMPVQTKAAVTAGVDWQAASLPAGFDSRYTLNDVYTSPSLIIAVAGAFSTGGIQYNDQILTSSNGISWTPYDTGVWAGLFAIAYDGKQYVVVGGSVNGFAVILTSSDGLTWISRFSGTSNALRDVLWNGSMFVAVGDAGTILTSPDGISWTQQVSSTINFLRKIAWNGSRYVAVGDSMTIVTSFNGITWATQTPPFRFATDSLTSIFWGASKFIVFTNRDNYLTSPDGVTWTLQTVIGNFVYGITEGIWDGTQFVAVGGGTYKNIITSVNGIGWSKVSSTGANAVSWTGSQFIAVGANTILRSFTDATPPSIITPANITISAIDSSGVPSNDPYIQAFLAGATASDNIDGAITTILTFGPVTTYPLGSSAVTFIATDMAGNTGTATATVTVNDTTAPVITINGANPATVEAGQVYTDALATVTDNIDPINAVLAGVSTVNTAAVGSYSVTYNASDVAGNPAIPVIRTVHVVDTTNPVLTLPANAVANATGVRTAVAIGTATATDLFAVTITNNAPVDFPIGTTLVSWTATDANGRVSTGLQQVVVNAVSTVPGFTLNNGSTVSLTAPVGETVFQVAGAAAPVVMPAGVNFPLGTLAYSVTSPFAGSVTMSLAFSTALPPVFTLYKIDNAGVVTAMPVSTWTKSGANTIQLTLTDGGAFDLDGLQNSVIVDPIAIGVDTQAPAITLTGSNPVTIAQGGTFTDPGTSVTDNVDTGLLATVTGTVNTTTVGTYILTYNVSDLTSNAAIALTRTVHVTDQTQPVVTPPTSISVVATSVTGILKTNTVIASFLNSSVATDNVGVIGAITNDAPATLPIGTTTVTFAATDAAGNAATATATVSVYIALDTTVPIITLTGGNITVIQGQIYTDAGATASDNVDGNITTSIVVNNVVNASVIGVYTITYNVSDAAGNHAIQLARTVNVVAGQPPLITLIGATPITLVQGAVYNDGGATAIDDVDGNVTANIATLNSVNTAVVASYTVTYNVSDAAGNAATQIVRTVNVIPIGGAANAGEAVQVPLTGSAASVDVHAGGQSISNFSATAISGTPPTGVSVPLGVLSYTTTVPAGAVSQTVNLSFSNALPASFVLYKVDNAGLYSIIPNGAGVDQWTQVDATTITLTLRDGGQFDLDGMTNGIIIDPVAVGVPSASTPVVTASSTPLATAGSGGGCTIKRAASFDPVMLVLLLFALIGLARRKNERAV